MNDLINWPLTLTEHRAWLETVIRARMFDRSASEDILQEVAVSVLRQENRPEKRESIAPWLYRIALRKIINYQRSQGRYQNLVVGYANERVDGKPNCDHGLSWLVASEQNEMIRSALNNLCKQHREILMLKYSHDWSYQRIADQLGVSVKTIEYRLLKARNSLKQQLHRLSEDAGHRPATSASRNQGNA